MKKKIYLTVLLSLSSLFMNYAPHGNTSIDLEKCKAFWRFCGTHCERNDLTRAADDLSYSIFNDKKIKYSKYRENPFILSHILLKVMCVFLFEESQDFFNYNALEESIFHKNNQFPEGLNRDAFIYSQDFKIFQEKNKGKHKIFFQEYKKNIGLLYEIIAPKEYQLIVEDGLKYLTFANKKRYTSINSMFSPYEKQPIIDYINDNKHKNCEFLKKNSFYDAIKTLIRVICYAPYVEPAFLLIDPFGSLEKHSHDFENFKYHFSYSILEPGEYGQIKHFRTREYKYINLMFDLHREFADYVPFFTLDELGHWKLERDEDVELASKKVQLSLNYIRETRLKTFRRDIFLKHSKILDLLAIEYLGKKDQEKKRVKGYIHPERKPLTVKQFINMAGVEKEVREKKWPDINNSGAHDKFSAIISKPGIIIEIGKYLFGKNMGLYLYDIEQPHLYYTPLLYTDNSDGLLKRMFPEFYKKDIYIRHNLLNIINIEEYKNFYLKTINIMFDFTVYCF